MRWQVTRRKAALILASIIGVMGHKTKAADQPPSWSTSGTTNALRLEPISGTANTLKLEPMSVSFYLDGFKDYVFYYKGKTLTFTPEQLFKALSDD